jgi:hypothetical protein
VTTGAGFVGWLLRANRRFGPADDLRSGRAFAAAFRVDGRPALAPSQVSRWETGELAVGRDVVRRYEQLLGLEPESLVTVRDALYRTLPVAGRVPAPSAPSAPFAPFAPFAPGGDDRLHELLASATSGHPLTGPMWSELTDLIESRPGLVLHPPSLWESIGGQLLGELTVGEGTGWLQRQEAASRLLEHPTAGPHLVRACIALVEDKQSPAVIEPLSLLDVTADPIANAYVLRQLTAPDGDREYQGALVAAVRKISQGHFTADQLDRLGPALREAPSSPLVSALQSAASASASASVSTPGLRADLSVSGIPIAAEAMVRLGGHDETDPVLAALIGRALDHPAVDQRVFAAMTIAHSPFRDPVGESLLSVCRRSLTRRAGADPSPALQMMTMLGTAVHRPLLADLLGEPGHQPETRHAAAWAMPHCAGRFPEQQWRRILARQVAAWQENPTPQNESILHAITYGIGTDAHPALLAEITTDPTLPAIARTTAAWLRSPR